MHASELKTERFQMLMEKSTLDAVDEWSFANRVRTRAEAIRQLIAAGLTAKAQNEKGTEAAA